MTTSRGLARLADLTYSTTELAMSRNVEETVMEDVLDRALTKSKLRFPDASAVAV